ncbi:CPW-WPC family protein [Plasmodium vinckei brucechwatti]|uniref:CPW-WPC family protein n=1 Tax=Plasmodium vinckei brucechwatti TaxID=119398 RepID=A0A6V7SHA6_PLAVN|nr:CPW-WPC family protein [Plasmodium vinckei brucechwatti]
MMKYSFIIPICFCFVFLNCSGDLTIENENRTKEKKIAKYNYGNLKKKINIEDNEKNSAFAVPENKGKESKDKEENNIIDEEYPNKEYKKCIDMVEKQFNDKEFGENQAIKDDLNKLCLTKKMEDEENNKKKILQKNEKETEEMSKHNKLTDIEQNMKEIISQLGLSSKIDISYTVLKELLSELKTCSRNYRKKCPLNWKISESNNEYCYAPDSYIGPCEKYISNDIDIGEKKQIEKKCLLFWECEKNCIQDFENSICPLDWILSDDEYCISPDNYKGSCLNKIKFIDMPNKEKSIYSNLCDIKWPCKEKCEHDYFDLCPDGWIETNDGYCLATNYNGTCQRKMNFKDLDKAMKQIYEQKCQFNYPCINSCEKNYDDLCPKSWIIFNENECAPSKYYNGNCKENYIFKNKNIEEKKNFEKLCNVSYPCLKKCQRDYSYNCPMGWKETLSFCLAPTYYKYDCNKMIKKNMNENEKKEISKNCNVFWPCSNYEIILKKLIYNNISNEDYLSIVNGPVDNTTGAIIDV